MRRHNPLNRRFLRDLKSDAGKYAVIFFLMMLSISFVSGFLVADNSMIIAYDESFERYNTEDGNFRVRKELSPAQMKEIRSCGAEVYEKFYSDEPLDNGSTLRLFRNREEVNLVCLMKGRLPSAENETAIDRMYADNNHLEIGDTVSNGERTWTITGLVALPDYSALYQNNNDTMFDSVLFGVGIVNGQGFESLSKDRLQHCYAWKYHHAPENAEEAHERSEAFLKQLCQTVRLEDYVPREENHAITFTGEDMGSDKSMMEILLYIIIIILAFVFAVTTRDTIRKESAVIGTLLASGYTRRELTIHYMTMSFLVTLVSALIGNVLGYSVMKQVAADMYYGSYSLPTYVTIWNAEAFLKTTLIPIFIMVLVTWFTLHRELKRSPLRFLRSDLSRRRTQRAFHLSHRLPIETRFRIRIILQNLGSYAVLFAGILFSNMLLMFGMQLPKLLDNMQKNIMDNMLADYQYVLKLPLSLADDSGTKLGRMMEYMEYLDEVETENESAEKFSVYSLKTPELSGIHSDEVMILGIAPDSRYIGLDIKEGETWFSSAFAEKYRLRIGDRFTMKEAYGETTYDFRVDGIADYLAGVVVFMRMEDVNRMFDLGTGTFAGYFSDTPITDIKEERIAAVIDAAALTKTSRQLQVSMGSIMYFVDVFAVIMYLILICLLTKLIIEKNAQSISLTKILGYSSSEIAGLYLFSTTIVVVVSMLVSIPVLEAVLVPVFETMMREMVSGWMPIRIDRFTNLLIFLIGTGSYGIVAFAEYRKIRSVPMEEALKHAE